MRTGRATYWQLTSLQAFWPGLQASSWTSNFHTLETLFDIFLSLFMNYGNQVLIGDVFAANSSHREFFDVWKRFGVLPERYFLIS